MPRPKTLRVRLLIWMTFLTLLPPLVVLFFLWRIGQALTAANFLGVSIIVISFTLLLAVIGANLLANSIERLTNTVRAIMAGDLHVRAEETDRDDEIGELARGLNAIVAERLELIQHLELRIQERTAQLTATAEISRHISELRDMDELLPLVVNMIQRRFGYYFVGILLLDEGGEALKLVAAAGTSSAERLLKQDKLAVGGTSIIGWVAQNNTPRVVHDVNSDPYFKRNSLLPDTRSEIALPLRQEGEMIGVLDIQADIRGEFDKDDVQSLQGLADLVAIALENARLFEQRKEYAQDMAKARERAEEASRAKTQFLANMSHELRTPMNAIIGFSQVMERDPNLSPKQQEYLEIISRSSDHLLQLINDVLEMSKIESGAVTLNEAPFDLHHLLNDMRELFQLRAEAKELDMYFAVASDVPRYIYGDQGKLRQVLINLVGNAIKFTAEGGISVRVGYEYGEVAPRLHFAVEDTGEGIAPEELDQLFKPFVQSASGRRSQEGTGLGLALSRQFIHMMGGDISIQSNLHQGTVVQFEIQVTIIEPSDIEDQLVQRRVVGLAADENGRIPTYRILVVDDRQTNRLLLHEWLTVVGFEVREAENGQEALAVWEEWQPHLVWMDMRMPVMDGYEATRFIKSSVQGQATAVIALTASTLEHERTLVLSAGCDDFVRKPVREAVIFEKMAEHLGVRYVYEEEVGTQQYSNEDEATVKFDKTVLALATLPADWLAELQQAAESIDVISAQKIIANIRPQNERLADTLNSLIEAFRFDTLQAMLQEVHHP